MFDKCIYYLLVGDWIFFFFFFQAEDCIRDDLVTGVQTCALPISSTQPSSRSAWSPDTGSPGRNAPQPVTNTGRSTSTIELLQPWDDRSPGTVPRPGGPDHRASHSGRAGETLNSAWVLPAKEEHGVGRRPTIDRFRPADSPVGQQQRWPGRISMRSMRRHSNSRRDRTGS